jgi:hypothetical protein
MGKLFDRLQKQLSTEYKEDAEKCIEVYNYLKEKDNGHVWDSQWQPLTSVKFIGNYPYLRIYSLTNLGEMVLKGIKSNGK